MYMWQPSGNGLVVSGIPKNPYFDLSRVSVASFCLISKRGIEWPLPIHPHPMILSEMTKRVKIRAKNHFDKDPQFTKAQHKHYPPVLRRWTVSHTLVS